MIVVRLKGGLGNQMFQYALGRTFQHRRKDELRIDVSYLLGSSVFDWDVPREYALDVFRIQPAFVYSPRLLSRVHPRQIRYPSGWIAGEAETVPRRQTFIHEAEFGFHPEVLDLTPPNLY